MGSVPLSGLTGLIIEAALVTCDSLEVAVHTQILKRAYFLRKFMVFEAEETPGAYVECHFLLSRTFYDQGFIATIKTRSLDSILREILALHELSTLIIEHLVLI